MQVKGATTPIHADLDLFALEHTREVGAGELRALVAVEYLGAGGCGDGCAPNLVGTGDFKAAQQVRVDPVLRVCPTGAGARCHALQAHLAHLAHQALDAFAINRNGGWWPHRRLSRTSLGAS